MLSKLRKMEIPLRLAMTLRVFWQRFCLFWWEFSGVQTLTYKNYAAVIYIQGVINRIFSKPYPLRINH